MVNGRWWYSLPCARWHACIDRWQAWFLKPETGDHLDYQSRTFRNVHEWLLMATTGNNCNLSLQHSLFSTVMIKQWYHGYIIRDRAIPVRWIRPYNENNYNIIHVLSIVYFKFKGCSKSTTEGAYDESQTTTVANWEIYHHSISLHDTHTYEDLSHCASSFASP